MRSFVLVVFTALCSGLSSAVSLPECQSTAPLQSNLTSVRTAYTLLLPPQPFGVIYAKEKDRAFVAATDYLIVLDTSTFPPIVLHNISLHLPGATETALGITLAQEGRYVLVTTESSSLYVVDASAAATGNSSAVVGRINGITTAGQSDIEVSAEGDFAFVSEEYGSAATDNRGDVEVFHLVESSNGTVSGEATGCVLLDTRVVGTAFSPDKQLLYATSQQTLNGTNCSIYGGSINLTMPAGTISVLNVTGLETNPSEALISRAGAGYGAVRAIVSPCGKYVWVTARESNHLLAFDAQKLLSDPNNALLASVQVGTSPIDLTFARNHSLILTADSNRYYYTNTTVATAGLSVVDVRAALEGRPAVLGSIPTGYFPREFATSPDGQTILVALYDSWLVQAIDVSTLPPTRNSSWSSAARIANQHAKPDREWS